MARMLNDENPELAAQWDHEKNGGMTPENTGFCSSRIVWWKCSLGHSWQSTVRNRTYGNGCPYCSGRRAIPGVSDLASKFPAIAAEWDNEKNAGSFPSEFTAKSQRKAWWKCGLGHSWQSSIRNRTDKGNGCPYCSGRSPLVGINDLAAKLPELAAEWDYEKNVGLTPDQITAKSNRRVWWRCSENHSWAAQVSNRSNLKSGCPYCSGLNAIQGVNDLATVNPVLAKEWDYDRNDGVTPDMVKTKSSSQKFWWKCKHGHSWQSTVAHRTKGHGCPYCSGLRVIQGVNDLATVYPALAAEWDYEKNGTLCPEQVKSKSGIKAWWKCDKGHSWQAIIYSRANGCGCPYCANQIILSGFNDLATINPGLAAEWDFEKNYPLKPDDVAPHSKLPFWWRCSLGHGWQHSIADRSNGSGCQVCAGKFIVTGFNDLETLFPELASQWDCAKNGGLSPNSVAPRLKRKVWWRCQKGHSWLATLRSRARGSGCPYCSSQAVLPGFNDLATADPALAAQWDYKSNGALMPKDVTPSSGRIVWWLCIRGHSWQTSVAHRRRGTNCPYCAGKKVLKGFNDISTTHPHIAAEWDCDMNGGIRPEDAYIGSTARAWWKCDKGHSWNAQIRTRMKCGCPYCAGNLPIVGVSDLGTMYPELIAEWDCERNGDMRPHNFTAASGKKVWWKCHVGHSWQATIASRSRSGNGCPYCAGKAILSGVNDLATLAPEILPEWDYMRNEDLLPESISLFSRIKVWWRCERGHSWYVSPFARSRGSRCPYCAGKRPPNLRLVD